MILKPKIPIFAEGNQLPSTVSWTDPNSTWYTRSGNGILNGTYNMLKSLHDKWKASGKDEDFLAFKRAVDNLNTTLREGYAPGHLKYESGGDQLFRGNNTAAWQNFVRNNYKFVNDAIGLDFEKKYFVTSQSPTSGDDPTKKWMVDDLWAGITDDRTTWGHLKNPNDPNYLEWKKKFDEIGIDYKVGPDEWRTGNVLYGFLREPEPTKPLSYFDNFAKSYMDRMKSSHPLNIPQKPLVEEPLLKLETSVDAIHKDHYGFDWNKLKEGALKVLSNPNLYAVGRLAGNLINNERVYDEALKGIKPVLKLTYNTHRQVVGDEATKQAYYRRAAQGLTKAALPFTSDADKQMAYLFEAKRVGDELRALGDLADNLEIRRTSDESNQHQWANTQRATEVANANLASINLANALKHNLLALKHSALWSSFDNFLQGIEYRRRKQLAEDLAFDDLIFNLQLQLNLLYDDRIIDAKKAYQDVLDKHKNSDGTYDLYNNEVIEAKRKFQALLNLIAIEQYKKRREFYRNRNLIDFAKSGTKITKKKKDDLLYKSARDTVEHFRKMSKISSDALNRKTPKIEKLTPHPKGNTRKYLLGGIAPFTVYKPVALGGETTTSSQYNTSSTKSSSKKDGSDTLDMIKELFKLVVGKGLDSDVNSLYVSMLNFLSRAQAFGEDISTEDIASMYLLNMLKLNQIQNLKAYHDKSVENAFKNDAINELAVRFDGALIGIKDGNLAYATSLKDANEKGLQLLTNGLLMELRSKFPLFAQRTDLDDIIANGIGMSKIQEYIKSINPKLGTTELTLEGYTKVEAGKILAGFELLQNAPDGDYKYTDYTKDLLEQMKLALRYISQALPKNMLAVIKLHADDRGVSPMDMITSLVGSGLDSETKRTYDAITGKAAKDANGNSKESGDGLKLDAATALISGKGYLGAIEFNPGTSYAVTVNARHSGFQKKSGENMGSGITMLDATTSTLDKVLDWNKATLGGSRISPTGYNRIMINNDDVVGVDLPVGLDKNIPDFTMLLKLQILDLELLKKGIEDTPNNWKQVNQICLEIGLPAKYKNDGSLNEYSWNRFAAFQVTADDSVLVNKNAILSDILGVVEDDDIRELYELIILKDNKNYKLGSGFLGLGKLALYLGTVFVPVNSNYVASALSGGQNISMLQATNLELKERGYDLLKITTYKPAVNINEL